MEDNLEQGGEDVAIIAERRSAPHSPLSPLMEEAEAGAVEGWVTTGSRRLSRETRELGSSLIGAEQPRFRRVVVVEHKITEKL